MSILVNAVAPLVVRAAEEGGEEHVSHALSFGIGAVVLVIFLALGFGLLAFGGGRDHS